MKKNVFRGIQLVLILAAIFAITPLIGGCSENQRSNFDKQFGIKNPVNPPAPTTQPSPANDTKSAVVFVDAIRDLINSPAVQGSAPLIPGAGLVVSTVGGLLALISLALHRKTAATLDEHENSMANIAESLNDHIYLPPDKAHPDPDKGFK